MRAQFVIPVLASILILGLFSIDYVYADVSSYDISKTEGSIQTQNNVQPATPDGYFFDSQIVVSPGDFASVNLGGATANPIAYFDDGSFWGIVEFFPSKTLLDNAYPNTPYTIDTVGGTLGTFNENISFGSDNFPTIVPYLTGNTYDNLQGVDVAQNISLTWNDASTSGATSIVITIEDDSYNVVHFEELSTSSTSTIIPSGTLSENTDYTLYLEFEAKQADSRDSFLTGTGFTAFYSQTIVDFSTSTVSAFFGPTPYTSVTDIPPGFYAGGSPTFLEDFEDGTLDGGIVASNGFVITPTSFPGFEDSVDADTGAIDGTGNGAHSWFIGFTSLSLTFTFPSPVVEAGIVVTDGSNTIDPVTFEAFGPGMVSLGTITDPAFGDTSNMGTTAEDRFFGVKDPTGIIAIKIIGTKVGENEVDHVQYGSPVITPVDNDLDDDGFDSLASGGTDCNDGDASINPGATEVAYDGIDNDCDGSDLTDLDVDGFDSTIVGGLDCNDNDSSIFPGAIEIIGDDVDQDCSGTDLTSIGATENVISDVETLVDDGDLNNGNGNALISKLDNAISKLENGNTNAAENQLNAFINQVNAFVNSGKLTVQQGQDLIDAVQTIVDSL